MNLEDIKLNEINQSLYDLTYMRYLRSHQIIKMESKMVASRGWGEAGMWSYCLLHTESEFFKIKGGLEMDGEDACTTM